MEISCMERIDVVAGASSQGRRAVPHTRRASSSRAGPQPRAKATWSAWLSTSVLAFASPELEAAFQGHIWNRLNLWTLFNLGHCLMGWLAFSQKYNAASPSQLALLPEGWYISRLHPIAAITMLALLLLRPAFFFKHRRALHMLFFLTIMATFRYARGILLWMRLLESPLAATLAQKVQSFAVENFFGSLIWLLVLAYPAGQIPDLLLTTLFLALELGANHVVCGGASVAHIRGLVTMSPKVLGVAETGTSWIFGTAAAGVASAGGAAPPPVITCPLALGFWQVIGWWMACHLVFAAEIARRRAFLRTTTAQNVVGPRFLASALNWPFGRVVKVLEIGLVSVAISCLACVIWMAALIHAGISGGLGITTSANSAIWR